MPRRYKLSRDDFEHLVCGGIIELNDQVQIALEDIGLEEIQDATFFAEEEHPRTGLTKRVDKDRRQRDDVPTPAV